MPSVQPHPDQPMPKHRKAMSLSHQAKDALAEGDQQGARELYRQAAELAFEAASFFSTNPPTNPAAPS